MSFKRILKYLGIIVIAYYALCFSIVTISMLTHHPDNSLYNTTNSSTDHSNVTYHNNSDYSHHNSRSYSYYDHHGSDLDDDWWYEEYGDYYNSAEAEDMGFYDDEDYLD